MSLEYGDMLKNKYVRKRLTLGVDMATSYLARFRKVSKRVLDIGCYTGDLERSLPSGIEYTGIDNDTEALEIAKSRGAMIYNIDIGKDPLLFLDGNIHFDAIFINELLEHLEKPAKFLSEVQDLSYKTLVISLPNENTIYHRLKILFGKGIGQPFTGHYHLHFPTIEQNEKFVSNYFKIIDKRYYIHLGFGIMEKILSKIPVWNLLARWFPSLFARGVVFLCVKKKK